MTKRFAGLLLLMVSSLPTSAQDPGTIHVGVDLVNVMFTVTDGRGRLINGLGPNDFVVEEDGKRQRIQHFSREAELPLTIGLVIDISPSVRAVFDEEKVTAVEFLDSVLRPRDLAFVISFDREVTLEQDLTDSRRALERAVEQLDIGSGTSLYDALYLAAQDKLKKEAGRKVVILISDGEDTTSRSEMDEALLAAHDSDVTVYAISNAVGGFLARRGGGSPRTLRRFSEDTGGTAFFLEGNQDFKKIFSRIADELRSQYSLAYVSNNPARDGKFRQIRIVPRNRNHKVQARKGYYAPKRANSP